MGRLRLRADEREHLRALVDQAWELRGTPYLHDACEAIGDWHERRALWRLERNQERSAALVEVLRDTDPDRLGLKAAA